MNSFDFECNGSGGLVLIEKNRVSTLTKELAASLDVVIDVNGETELVFDYAGQNWKDVWSNELKNLNGLIRSGLMFVGLLKDGEYEIDFDQSNDFPTEKNLGFIKIEKSPLLVVEAGELIQKVFYPNLEFEIAYELSLKPGSYCVRCGLQEESVIKIDLFECEKPVTEFNVVELSGRL